MKNSRMIEDNENTVADSPSRERVHRAALLARKNALTFVDDAKALLESQSPAHAFGLLVLAEEEIGKSVIFHLYADGVINNPEWLAIATRKHEAKHATMAVTIMLRIFLLVFFGLGPTERIRSMRRRLKSVYPDSNSGEVLAARIRTIVEDLPSFLIDVASLLEEISDLGQLQRNRERTFFVDFDIDGNPIDPLSVSKAECRDHLTLVAARIDAAESLMGSRRYGLKRRQKHNRVPRGTEIQIAKFESYIFGKKKLRKILEWLSGPNPMAVATSVREYAYKDEDVRALTAKLKETILNN